MSLFPLDLILNRIISYGKLTVVDTDGSRRTFTGRDPGPSATMRIHDPGFRWKVIRNPQLVIGEGYMNGAFTIEDGSLRDFLDVLMVAADRAGYEGVLGDIGRKVNRVVSFGRSGINNLRRARRNIQHHYDVDQKMYELFLDADLQYSCAYWRDGVTTLEEAQFEKKRHIARKLLLKPGMKVLDIGSGWGGMAIHLAKEHGVHVTGVTLSTDQYETSVRRAREAGVADLVKFQLLDYRHEPGPFDRIVSVGMFEHVGEKSFGEYFDHVDRLLKPDGVALIHTIARMPHPAPVNAWTLKYIFPGGYLPTLSQLSPLLENRRLWLTDFEALRLHYAKTLFEWDRRFQLHRADIAKMHDERFCRMWEFYLQSAERAFHHQGLAVFQLQIAKDIRAVPLTRDYMYPGAGVSPIAEATVPPEDGYKKPRLRTTVPSQPVEIPDPVEAAKARRPAATPKRKRATQQEPAE